MDPKITLVPKETHNTCRQQMMRKRATETARRLQCQPGVLGVLLSGSAARGPVGEASDLDLHIIVSNSFPFAIPEWTFHEDGTIENLHTVSEDALLRGWRVRNNSNYLAAWFYATKLGDELHGHIPLWWDTATHWQRDLSELISHREERGVAQRVAQCYLAAARSYLSQGRAVYDQGAFYDSHQRLRMAFQLALIAALIARGWFVRGSKKRIEIAQTFLPSFILEPLMEVGFNAVGLTGLTPDQAAVICDVRFQFRTILLDELHRLKELFANDAHIAGQLEAVIKNQEEHNALAYDYYSPLIKQGMILGPINHIRCLSGLPHIPQTIISCWCGKQTWPIKEFARSGVISPIVVHSWLETMALSSSQKHLNHLLASLSSAIDNLEKSRDK